MACVFLGNILHLVAKYFIVHNRHVEILSYTLPYIHRLLFLKQKNKNHQRAPIHIPFTYREPCNLRRRKGPETHRVPSSRRIAVDRFDFRRIS